MDPASARYLIRINGHLGATFLSAFPAMAWRRQGSETVLTGVLDRAALYGVLAEIEALSLDLLEVRQLTPEDGRCQRRRVEAAVQALIWHGGARRPVPARRVGYRHGSE
jgi:hypothetical protein